MPQIYPLRQLCRVLTAVLVALIFYSGNAYSNCTAIGTGDWSDASSWTCDAVSTPGCCDTITIRGGDDIRVDVLIDLTGCGPIHIIVSGILRFKTGKKLLLPSGSTIDLKVGGSIIPGGGGGSSNYIEIDGTSVWTAGDGTAIGPLFYTDPSLLPIELIDFKVLCEGGKVEISWTTASEENNDYFEIQRSKDGVEFNTIITAGGAGNSSSIVDYFEIDYDPLEEISYYRLKQVDFNGDSETFNIVPNQCFGQNEPATSLFPNPVSVGDESVNLFLEGFENQEVLVFLRDITGKEYYSKVTITKNENELIAIPLDLNIPPGNYIVTASSNNSIYSKVLVIKPGSSTH